MPRLDAARAAVPDLVRHDPALVRSFGHSLGRSFGRELLAVTRSAEWLVL
ncbi:hypothetical protein [Nonomuraea sp. GTA35]